MRGHAPWTDRAGSGGVRPKSTHPGYDPMALTPREQDVYDLLVRGASNGEIAAALGLRPCYIHRIVHILCQKRDCRHRLEMVVRHYGGDPFVPAPPRAPIVTPFPWKEPE